MEDVPNDKRQAAINYAKEIVQDQTSLDATPYERLWQVARKLNVSRIEPGATRTQGFVKRLHDGSYGVYFSSRFSISRRRYTVAHELAHLVLERFVPHIRPEQTVARGATRNTKIERVVDRIGSELLMPEHLVRKALVDECQRERMTCNDIGKHRVLRVVQERFGVSESAMAFRLIEVPQLLTVIVRVMFPDAPKRLRDQGYIVQTSQHCCALTLVDEIPVIGSSISLNRFQRSSYGVDVEVHSLMIDSHLSRRLLKCAGWVRQIPIDYKKYHEYWILGWTWNSNRIPSYDDTTIAGFDS